MNFSVNMKIRSHLEYEYLYNYLLLLICLNFGSVDKSIPLKVMGRYKFQRVKETLPIVKLEGNSCVYLVDGWGIAVSGLFSWLCS